MAISTSDSSVEGSYVKWQEFFDEPDIKSKVIEAAETYPDIRSVILDFTRIDTFAPELAENLLDYPEVALAEAHRAMTGVIPPSDRSLHLNVRIRGIPKDSHIAIRDLRSKHLGKMISVEGLVRKATEVRPLLKNALFECLRCKAINETEQDGLVFREPLDCVECKRAAGSTRFRLLPERSIFIDTQKLEVQENPEGMRGGAQPQRLIAYADDDIVGNVFPGDRVTFNGILRSTQKTDRVKSNLMEIHIEVSTIERSEFEYEEIEITPEEEEEIRKRATDPEVFEDIRKSISPTIYGMETEKRALVLQLFGGVAKTMPDGTKIRGDIHILFVGDPGTAKSQLLRYMSNMAPRGIYASGKSSSGAGLTAAAVKDEFGEGRWTLEAGALVLADMGVACIDEMDKMSAQDRSSMHEAMEQQTVSVAKAGIYATLQSRCSILGAANPKYGRFDEQKYFAEQIDMPPPLLSRFDVIFSIQDRPRADQDRKVAEHIIRSHLIGEIRQQQKESSGDTASFPHVDTTAIEPVFDTDFMRKYVKVARRINPIMTEEAMAEIQSIYVEIRKGGEAEGASVPITPRQLEAIVRMAEASARTRLSTRVVKEDAELAVQIIRYYLGKVATDEGQLDIDMLTTGMPKSQRDAIPTITDIVTELLDTTGEATKDEIFEKAESRGIDRAKAERIFKRLVDDGTMYEARPGKYRLTNG